MVGGCAVRCAAAGSGRYSAVTLTCPPQPKDLEQPDPVHSPYPDFAPPAAVAPDGASVPSKPDGHGDPAAEWVRAYEVRTFCPEDVDACRRLYTDGLLGGQILGNDTGLDIDDIAGAYLADPLNHFWVARVADGCGELCGARDGHIVGMIGVQHHDEGVGEVRRLRVDPAHRRRRVGSRLLDTAIRFCRETGCLKVALDTYIERDAAVNLFERHRFRHGRTRQVHGKDMLYFYLDLYSQDRRDG